MAAEIIMLVAYGIQVQDKDDPFIIAAERGARPLSIAGVAGTFLVDVLPVLKHVPEWMPFAGFKHKAKEWRGYARTMLNMPFEAALLNIKNGTAQPSFVSCSLDKIDGSGDVEHQKSIIKSTAGAMYAAGSDTTVVAITTFVLGLLSNPQALKKAQQEIDSVIGTGIPHFIEVEDEYKGYRIPAGSIVIANSWAILHDENPYPDPFAFNPDRFIKNGKLNLDIKDPSTAAFGFGRRICPGRHMAYASIWIVVVSMVATLDITKAVDEDGEFIEPDDGFVSGIARSRAAEVLIRGTLEAEYF
ncbi:hypothetical protein H0H81_008519 [Sphagnurus paluster]|uniref:Cytochrome P450 n=1 Tax=Sphagnurus paluster TaxID=117069 RepID=A0A9P7FS47_9AGAR|nr:hypothetical protein H0H81_008519 [Sphagnurus paluster]